MVHALACVCKSAGKNLGPASKEAIEELVHETFRQPGLGEHYLSPPLPARRVELTSPSPFPLSVPPPEPYNAAIANVVGGLAIHSPEDVRTIIETRIIPSKPSILSSLTVLAILELAPETFETLGNTKGVVKKTLASCAVIDNPSVGRPAREAREIFRGRGGEEVLAMLEG